MFNNAEVAELFRLSNPHDAQDRLVQLCAPGRCGSDMILDELVERSRSVFIVACSDGSPTHDALLTFGVFQRIGSIDCLIRALKFRPTVGWGTPSDPLVSFQRIARAGEWKSAIDALGYLAARSHHLSQRVSALTVIRSLAIPDEENNQSCRRYAESTFEGFLKTSGLYRALQRTIGFHFLSIPTMVVFAPELYRFAETLAERMLLIAAARNRMSILGQRVELVGETWLKTIVASGCEPHWNTSPEWQLACWLLLTDVLSPSVPDFCYKLAPCVESAAMDDECQFAIPLKGLGLIKLGVIKEILRDFG